MKITSVTVKKIDKEKRAIKELLLYLRSPQEMNKFIEHMDQIESLPFDVALIQEYVADLCNKTVSVDLIDSFIGFLLCYVCVL